MSLPSVVMCLVGTVMGPKAEEAPLSVATMNIWVGGQNADADKVKSRGMTLAALKKLDADLIGMQEQKGFAAEYAAGLGYQVVAQDDSTAILTRLAVEEVTKSKWGARLRREDGSRVWMFNVHFPAAPYQPYQLAGIEYHDGRLVKTAEDAVTEARLARGENAVRCLREMQAALREAERGEAVVIVTGDFNEPSCLDWTNEAMKANVERFVNVAPVTVSVDWPTSRMFHDAGMKDAYRAVYPDPAAAPGFTWSPRADAKDVMDRIDLVLWKGAWVVTKAEVVGEKGQARVVEPWPSDHRGVRVEMKRE